MLPACLHAVCMSTTKLLQVRNVPASLHRKMKTQAASRGKTLSDLVLEILQRHYEHPSIEEWLAELRKMPKTRSTVSSADIIRESRGPL